MRRELVALGAACIVWTVSAGAASSIPSAGDARTPMPNASFESEFEDEHVGWKEIEAQLPPYPHRDNLVRVQTGSATSSQYYVDVTSISVGADDVVRFTVVTRAGGGALNVTYEGMRCETRERKLYAVGHSDGTWARARDTRWQRVVLRDLTPHHHTLFHDFFCAKGKRPVPVREAVAALKNGRGVNPRPME